MLVSVAVVVHRSDQEVVWFSLDSLVKEAENYSKLHSLTMAICVLDNSLDDVYSGSLRRLLKKLNVPQCVSLEHRVLSENAGFGCANNVVIPELKSRYHLIMNPDVRLAGGALLEALQFMEAHPQSVLLTPRIQNADGSYSHVAKSYPDAFTLILRYLSCERLNKIYSRQMSEYTRCDLAEEIDSAIELAGGCFLIVRTIALQKVGGFDERFFLYFEDFDLSIQLRNEGQLSYVPSVVIEHDGGDVGRKGIKHHLFCAVSAIRFFNKHGWKLFQAAT